MVLNAQCAMDENVSVLPGQENQAPTSIEVEQRERERQTKIGSRNPS